MKKLLALSFIGILLFSTLLLISCDNSEENASTSKNPVAGKLENLTNSKIGTEEEGKFKLAVKETSILEAAKKFITEANLKLEPQSVKIVTIEKKKYLRIFSKNGYVSTIELVLDSSKNYNTGGTICTSIACASGGGCIPDGSYCTACKTGVNGSLSGDCTRTTSSSSNASTEIN